VLIGLVSTTFLFFNISRISLRTDQFFMRAFAYLNVSNPWIAWLVYRGEMIAAPQVHEQAISVWHAEYLIDLARSGLRVERYQRELELEKIRAIDHPNSVSRLTGLYLFPTLEDARAAQSWGGCFKPENLSEVEITSVFRQSRYDSEWISRAFDSLRNDWIAFYFSGVACGANAIWELLVHGRALVLGTELRKRSYETVAALWPKSLALLELSRMAVCLGSDLGVITPIVTTRGGKLRLDLMLDFRDATNEVFLDRLKVCSGPKNRNDLNASSEIVVPDLSHLSTEILL
jgi:hypothetical protein